MSSEQPNHENQQEHGGQGGRDMFEDIQSRIEAAIDELRPKVKRAMDELDARVDSALNEIRPRVDARMRDARPRVDRFVAEIQPRMDEMIRRMQTKLEDLRQDLESRASRGADEEGGDSGMGGAADPAPAHSSPTDGEADASQRPPLH
jgi:ElaB/YqjD/DUF883 family membrane-anchored ribosome-binding protein